MKRRTGRGGFTLIELILVIAILAVLAAIGIPYFIGYIQNAQAAACQVNRRNLRTPMNIAFALGKVPTDEAKAALFDEQKAEILCPAGGE